MALRLCSHFVLASLSAAGEAVRIFKLRYDTDSTVLRSIGNYLLLRLPGGKWERVNWITDQEMYCGSVMVRGDRLHFLSLGSHFICA